MGQQICLCHIIHVMNTIPKKSYAPRLGQTPVFLSEYLSLTVSGIGRKITGRSQRAVPDLEEF